MSYTPPHLRVVVPAEDQSLRDQRELVRRRSREYRESGAPTEGEVDKVKLAPNVYFFRRQDGSEGLGIWWTPPGSRKVKCKRLPGMPTIEQATREAQRRRVEASTAPAPSQATTIAIDAADAASGYLAELRSRVRAAGAAGSNDTRQKMIEESTWKKKRSAFSTVGLLSDVGGRYPELLGASRQMARRERERRRLEAMPDAERREAAKHDPGPLAGLRLGEIDETALVEAIQYLTDRGLTPATVVSYLQQLRPFFRYCVRKDLILIDPFVKLSDDEIPSLSNLRKRALTVNEQRRLFAQLPDGIHRLGAIFDVNVGPRIGERLALVWDDFDFENSRVRIDSSLTRTDPHGRLKTDAGVRDPPFPADLGEALQAWREVSPAAGPDDPVWCRPDGRPYTTDAYRKKILAPAVDRAGLNDGLDRRILEHAARWVTQHSLRHTYASMLLSNPEIALATASMLLGHADTTVTQRVYLHFIEDDRHEHPVRKTIDAHVRETIGDNLLEFVGL